MEYYHFYKCPFSFLLIKSDGIYLTELSFISEKDGSLKETNLPIFAETKKWLDEYFSFQIPSFVPPYKLSNVTFFQKRVLEILMTIPYGETTTYGKIANILAKEKGISKMSSQAVGNAVGRNPICIIIPCHRVIGKKGDLVGYHGGLSNKKELLSIEKKRCKWCNKKNPKYIHYHDQEWGKKRVDDAYLFEMLLLENFQAGLSFECVLNKREDFRTSYDNFSVFKVASYKEEKIKSLMENKKLIRNRLKIEASIQNAKVFLEIQKEYGSFHQYLETFTKGKTYFEVGKVKNELADKLSKDLQKRGMKFVGSIIIYSYLQAIGVIYSHEKDCFLYQKKED